MYILYLNEEQDFKIDLQLKNLHLYNNNNTIKNNKVYCRCINNGDIIMLHSILQWYIVCLYNLLWSGGTGQDGGALSIQCTWQE